MKKITFISLPILLYILLVFGCKTTKNSTDIALYKDFQSLLDSSINANMPGILVHVECPQKNISWAGAAGVSDVKTKTPLTPKQCFRTASVTKTFVACTILRLFEEGKLSLDDPITRYIAQNHIEILTKGGYQPDKMTIRHLLSHSSGMFDHAQTQIYFEKIQVDPSHIWTRTEQLTAAIEWGKPVGAVGEKFSYSDTGYCLLGETIEKITGKNMGEVILEKLNLKGLGIKNTVLEDAQNAAKNPTNRIHQYLDGADTYHYNPSIDLYGGGGLLSTSTDLALFYYQLFHNKVFKNKATLDTMLTKVTYQTGTPRMDYRKGIYAIKLNGLDAYTHSGYWGTQVVYVPSLDLAIAANYSQAWRTRGQAPVLEKVVAIIQKNK